MFAPVLGLGILFVGAIVLFAVVGWRVMIGFAVMGIVLFIVWVKSGKAEKFFRKGAEEQNRKNESDLMWAQAYALGNRERMMDVVLDQMRSLGQHVGERRRINCHHNYTAMEHHRGKDIWITRKGAIRARVGDYGVIPGSMGTSSFIVKGLGNPASFESAAHGAGRKMSRRQAKRDFTAEQLTELMEGKTWLADKADALLDEIPGSYKDIHSVMADQADLVEVENELTQILNFKGA